MVFRCRMVRRMDIDFIFLVYVICNTQQPKMRLKKKQKKKIRGDAEHLMQFGRGGGLGEKTYRQEVGYKRWRGEGGRSCGDLVT